ncbi:hypothetical protein [Phormidesmis priestleyi]|uniref:hypothetical protein n=1 Tax=Phormidesmis priestleyi TaxID=268141 RepID=UPI000839EFB7|nr:hypothetical protein [Phormidesmis priestleyi]
MAGAAFIIELLLQLLHLVPSDRNAQVLDAGISFNYTTILSIVFLVLAVILVTHFVKTGEPDVLRMMNHPTKKHEQRSHHAHH